MANFADRVVEAVRARGNAIVMGIDPRPERLPTGFLDRFEPDRAGVARALGAFGAELIELAAGAVPAVKFQSAFFEAYGPEGVAALFDNVRQARERGLIVLFDGKRNDIGSTAEAYARGYLGEVAVAGRVEEVWGADAATINPYLGVDGIDPFLRAAAPEGRGAFALVRTSNPSSGDFQELIADGRPLYRHVAEHLARWAEPYRGESGYSALGAVVGATFPEQLAELRGALPGILFLIPGYGAQGGSAADIAAACDDDGLGALVNCSRGLIFAYERDDLRRRHGDDWKAAVRAAIAIMAEDLGARTPMGRLSAGPPVP